MTTEPSPHGPTDRVRIYVDADACPVKDEIYRVADRHGLHVTVVSNRFIMIPPSPTIERVVVGDGLDVADDWIAERADPRAIVVTADIPLADRCVKAGATAIAPNGRLFTPDTIGMALATRNLMADLREAGTATGGPKPFAAKDRSAFLSALDQTIRRKSRDAGHG